MEKKLSLLGPTSYLQYNSFYYRRSSIKTSQGAYLFSTHLKGGGVIEMGGLILEGGLINLAQMMVSVLHKK